MATPALDALDLFLVDIHANCLMPFFRQTRARDQADVSRAND